MIIWAPATEVISAFVAPDQLARFWLSSSSAPLAVGVTVHWKFMVPGAEADATATRLEPGRGLSWKWSDGTTVDIDVEPADGGTAVTLVNAGFEGTAEEIVEAALNATEGFALVLADLKTLLESGGSAHLVRDKAKLIALRK
jgi:uncharacterized protein YndB with AHSA1/START domain